MLTRIAKRCGVFVAILGACSGPLALGASQPPALSRGEIARRGREATAFLEVGQGRSATAFCVHPSGLFVTNNHVFENPIGNGEIRVVVDSGTLDQKVLKATVVRRDREADLALLRVEPAGTFKALPLGSAGALEELMEVIVFGFPFGRGVGAARDQYPSISVNQGAISSLRRKDGKLQRIQMNAAVNPGNSGGPLLDPRGQVVGAVLGRVEGNFGAGVDLAIPVNLIDQFLARPEITFKTDHDDMVKVDEPVEFTASVVSVIPTKDPLDLQLVFAAGTPDERHVPLTRSEGSYKARAVPFPAPKGPQSLKVEVTYADGAVKGSVTDRAIDVGGKAMPLSTLGSVQLGPKPEARAADGRVLEGAPAAPRELTLVVGGQELRLDLRKALAIDVPDAGATGAVSCTLVTLRGGDEVGRTSLPLYLEGMARPSFAALREGRFIRPPRSTSPVSYLRVESSPGDYIGQGKSYSYDKEELTFQPWANGIRCQVGSIGNWTILFGAGQGRNLEAAEYRDAKRHPFAGESPGIEFNGNGRGCNTISGAFRIWEIETKGNTVVHLAVDFVQRCDGKGPPLVGMLRYNSTFY